MGEIIIPALMFKISQVKAIMNLANGKLISNINRVSCLDIGNEMNDDSSDDDSPHSDQDNLPQTPSGFNPKKKSGLRSLTPSSENIPVETTSEINIAFAHAN